jgi:hypothetical protein
MPPANTTPRHRQYHCHRDRSQCRSACWQRARTTAINQTLVPPGTIITAAARVPGPLGQHETALSCRPNALIVRFHGARTGIGAAFMVPATGIGLTLRQCAHNPATMDIAVNPAGLGSRRPSCEILTTFSIHRIVRERVS